MPSAVRYHYARFHRLELRLDATLDVVNGQKNDIFVSVENKSDRNVTLLTIAGSFHHPDTNKLIKNVRTCNGVGSHVLTCNTDNYLDVPHSPAGGRKAEAALLIL